jgi:hypothetical protein
LESLTVGKEEELRAQAEAESQARVAEIMGRKPAEEAAPVERAEAEEAVVEAEEEAEEHLEAAVAWLEEPEAEAEEVEAEETPDWLRELEAEPEAEAALSGDDALAWLESLTVGKEEELRAQAETESQARVAEIMGRKPAEEAAPVERAEAEETVVEAEEEAETPTVKEEEIIAEAEEEAPVLEEEALSGDDALAWLETLTVGKEEELRAQAEAETRTRVDELMGRKPAEEASPIEEVEAAPIVEAEIEETEALVGVEEAEPKPAPVKVVGEVSPTMVEEGISGREEFFGWSSFGEQRVEFGGEMPTLAPRAVLIGETFFGWTSFGDERRAFGQDIKIDLSTLQSPVAEQEVEETPLAAEAVAKPEVEMKTSEELDVLREQVEQDPSDYEARLVLARALWAAGTHKESLDHYNRLIREDYALERVLEDLQLYAEEHPDSPNLLRALGDVYMKQDLLDEAMNLYKEAMALL